MNYIHEITSRNITDQAAIKAIAEQHNRATSNKDRLVLLGQKDPQAARSIFNFPKDQAKQHTFVKLLLKTKSGQEAMCGEQLVPTMKMPTQAWCQTLFATNYQMNAIFGFTPDFGIMTCTDVLLALMEKFC